MMRSSRLILAVMALALAGLACNLPSTGGQATQLPTAELPTSAASKPEPTQAKATQASPTTAPAAKASPTAAPKSDLVEFNYKGVKFAYKKGMFSGVNGQIAPAQVMDAESDGWTGSVPETVQIKFEGYPVDKPSHEPQLLVFPIKVFAGINAPAGTIAQELDDTLKAGNFSAKAPPFLPMWNAGQMFHVQGTFVGFKNGKGLRYLTCYAQAIVPVNNTCLFYTFQGKTADGNYYISAILPVQLPVLDSAENKARFEAASADGKKFDAYIKEMVQLVDQANPADFKPSLEELDKIMATLDVTPEVALKAPPKPTAGAVSCPGAVATQLKINLRIRVTFTDGTPLRLRSVAGKDGTVLATIPEGGKMTVLGGPTCLSGGNWWKVKVDSSGQTGWVLEGEKGVYFIEPLP